MIDELKPGDRVQTTIGTVGTIQEPPFLMPLHHLVKFDNGSMLWVLRKILQPCPDVGLVPEIDGTLSHTKKRKSKR